MSQDGCDAAAEPGTGSCTSGDVQVSPSLTIDQVAPTITDVIVDDSSSEPPFPQANLAALAGSSPPEFDNGTIDVTISSDDGSATLTATQNSDEGCTTDYALNSATSAGAFEIVPSNNVVDGDLVCFDVAAQDAAGNADSVTDLKFTLNAPPDVGELRAKPSSSTQYTPLGSGTPPTFPSGPFDVQFDFLDNDPADLVDHSVTLWFASSGPCGTTPPASGTISPAWDSIADDDDPERLTNTLTVTFDSDDIAATPPSEATICVLASASDTAGAAGAPSHVVTAVGSFVYNQDAPDFALGAPSSGPGDPVAFREDDDITILSGGGDFPITGLADEGDLATVRFFAIKTLDRTTCDTSGRSPTQQKTASAFLTGGFTWNPASPGVYCLAVEAEDDAGNVGTGAPGFVTRVAIDDDANTFNNPYDDLEPDRTAKNVESDSQKKLIFLREGSDSAIGFRGSPGSSFVSISQIQYIFKDGNTEFSTSPILVPANGFDPDVGDFWNFGATLTNLPRILACETPANCEVPEGDYDGVDIRFTDAHGRQATQSISLNTNPSNSNRAVIVVDQTRPDAEFLSPVASGGGTASVARGEFFDVEVEAGDDPIGEYDADPSEDAQLQVTINVVDGQNRGILWPFLDSTGNPTTSLKLQYDGDTSGTVNPPQPFSGRIKVPTSTELLGGGGTPTALGDEIADLLAGSGVGTDVDGDSDVDLDDYVALALVAIKATPRDAAGLTPRDASIPFSDTIEIGQIDPALGFRPIQDNDQFRSTITNPGSSCTAIDPCEVSNSTRPYDTDGDGTKEFAPFEVVTRLTNNGTIRDDLELSIRRVGGQVWPAEIRVGSQAFSNQPQSVSLESSSETAVQVRVSPPTSASAREPNNEATYVLEVRSDKATDPEEPLDSLTFRFVLAENTLFRSLLSVNDGPGRRAANLTVSPTNTETVDVTIENRGNTEVTYDIDLEPRTTGDPCTTTTTSDRTSVVTRIPSGQTVVTLGAGASATIPIEVLVERFAPAAPVTPITCMVEVAPQGESRVLVPGADADPEDPKMIRINIPADPRLDMFEADKSPADGGTVNVIARPGSVVTTNVLFQNKGNTDLNLRNILSVAGDRELPSTWSWNEEDATIVFLEERGASGNLDEATIPIVVTVAESAIEGEQVEFDLIATAESASLNSMHFVVEVGSPGNVSVERPTNPEGQYLADGDTITLPVFIESRRPFGTTGDAEPKPLIQAAGEACTGQLLPKADAQDPVSITQTTVSFNMDVRAADSGTSWTLTSPANSDDAITCTFGAGEPTIAHIRPGAVSKQLVFLPERPVALALGYAESTGPLAEAELLEPTDLDLRPTQQDALRINVAGIGAGETAQVHLHQGQDTDGWERIFCTATSCPDGTHLAITNLLAPGREIPFGVDFPETRTSTTTVDTRPEGHVTHVLAREALHAGWNPLVFRVEDRNGALAASGDDASLTVEVEMHTADQYRRALSYGDSGEAFEARNLGEGWFAVDLLLPLVGPDVTRFDLFFQVSGKSETGFDFGTAAEGAIRFGTMTADPLDTERFPDLLDDATDLTGRTFVSGTTSVSSAQYYLDVNGDGTIQPRDDIKLNDGRTVTSSVSNLRTLSSGFPGETMGLFGLEMPGTGDMVYYLSTADGPGDLFAGDEFTVRITRLEVVDGTRIQSFAAWRKPGSSDDDVEAYEADASIASAATVDFDVLRVGSDAIGSANLVRLYMTPDGAGMPTYRLMGIQSSSGSDKLEAGTMVGTPPTSNDVLAEPEHADVVGGLPDLLAADGAHAVTHAGKATTVAFATPRDRVGPGTQTVRFGVVAAAFPTGDSASTMTYSEVTTVFGAPKVPTRPPSDTGFTKTPLSDAPGPWLEGRYALSAFGSLERLMNYEVELGEGNPTTVSHAFIVDPALHSQVGPYAWPVFIEINETVLPDPDAAGALFDHRAIPGLQLAAGTVTVDVVAFDADTIERPVADAPWELFIADAVPPTLTVDVPAEAEVGTTIELLATALDDAGIGSVRATITPPSGSSTTITLAKTKMAGLYRGTYDVSADGTHEVTITATDIGGNSVSETVEIEVGANQAPRINTLNPVVDGTVFVAPGGDVRFNVTDASITDGEITVTASGGGGPSQDLGDLTGDDGNVTVSGLGESLFTGPRAVTVAVENDGEAVTNGFVWLNVTGPTGATSSIAGNATDAAGESDGRVQLPNTGTATVTVEAFNRTDGARDFETSATFTVSVVESSAGGDALSIKDQSCAASTCTVTVNPGLGSDGASTTLVVLAVDGTGLENERSFDVEADGADPTIAIVAQNPKVDGTPVTVGTGTPIRLDLDDAGSGIAGSADVRVSRSDGTVRDTTAGDGNTFKLGDLGISTSGRVSVQATVKDALGNEASRTTDFDVDVDAPSLSNPSLQQGSTGVVASITADDEAGIKVVNFHYDTGAGFTKVPMEASNGAYSATVSSIPSSGMLEYYYTARDTFDNEANLRSSSDPFSFELGTAPSAPTVQIVRPAANDRVRGVLTVEWVTAGDGDISLVSATVEREGVEPLTLDPGAAPRTATFDTRAFSDGPVTITIEVTNGAQSATATRTVEVDNVPVVTLSPDAAVGEETTVTFPVPVTNPTSVRVQVLDADGNVVSEGDATANPDGTWSYTFTPESEGSYSLSVTAAGDEGETTFTTESFGIGEAVAAARPVFAMILVAIVGVAVIGAAGYGAFGRWK